MLCAFIYKRKIKEKTNERLIIPKYPNKRKVQSCGLPECMLSWALCAQPSACLVTVQLGVCPLNLQLPKIGASKKKGSRKRRTMFLS